jgi:cysteinyl-tRNA synthetase
LRPKQQEGASAFLQLSADARADFLAELADDLNTPRALAVVHEYLRAANAQLDASHDEPSAAEAEEIRRTLRHFDSVLALIDLMPKAGISPELKQLLDERNAARAAKDFQRADELREQLLKAGYKILDTKTGSHLEKV